MDLLEEFTNEYEILKEGTDGGQRVYKIRGVMSRINTPNKNKRIYKKEVMEQAINEVQELINANRFVGEIEHPSSIRINMDRISHKITELSLSNDGAVLGEMIPAGPLKDTLISIIEDGIGFGVSTRGNGNLRPYNGELGEGLLEVQPGFQLRAIDIVHDPSAGAFPSVVKENVENIFTVPSNFKAIWNDIFNKG